MGRRVALNWWLKLAVALNALEKLGVSVQLVRDQTTHEMRIYAFGSPVRVVRRNGVWTVLDES